MSLGRRKAWGGAVGALALLVAAGALPWLFNAPAPRAALQATLRPDLRCRGGCPPALLRILPGGPGGNVATGVLTTSNGRPVTVARASGKSCLRGDGTLVKLGNNAPCVEPQGLLIEGPATNGFIQSESFQTAAAWDPEAVGVSAPTATGNSPNCTTPAGDHTATEVVFPAVAAGQQSRFAQGVTSIAAATTYTMAVWAWVETGTASFFMGVDGAGTGPDTAAGFTLTTVPQRISMEWTSVAGGSFNVPYIGGDLRGARTAGPMAATTVCLWGADFKAGHLSSYVQSGATNGTRAGDVVSVPNPLTLPTFTFAATVTPQGPWADGNTHVILDSGGGFGFSVQVLWWQADGKLAIDIFDDAGADAFYNSASPLVDGPRRLRGSRVGASTFAATVDGAAAPGGTGGTVATLTQPASLYIGSDSFGRWLNGWMSDVCVTQGTTGACP